MRRGRWHALLLLAAALGTGDARAEVRLAGLFGDHMVLQRHAPIRVWGWADAGDVVTVQFRASRRRTVARADGRWQVTLPAAPAGGPHELRVSARNTLRLHDVLVGELWLASGQSNMEWPLKDVQDGAREVAEAGHPQIRELRVPHRVALRPAEDIAATPWQVAGPDTAGGFSAVAYFFARRLQRELGVPVGIVHASWGGSELETWTSPRAALADPALRDTVRALPSTPEALALQRHERARAMALAWQQGLPVAEPDATAWAASDLDDQAWPTLQLPGLWEAQGLPGLDGVVWLRRRVVLDAAQAAAAATLHLGRVDDCDESFVNGVRVGGFCGWDTPRHWPVPAGLLHAGENVIAVRVTDTGGGGGPYGDAALMQLSTATGEVALAGRWRARVGALPQAAAVGPNDAPTLLFNGMVHALRPLRLRGVLWYQGESNVARAADYAAAFQRLIVDWRAQWAQPAMPFYFVQLAPFLPLARNSLQGSAWAELRDAQRQALALPRTGMVVTTDVGDADDIHPRRKQPVGERLAGLALRDVHGRRLEADGPVFAGLRLRDGAALLRFRRTAGGLGAREGGARVQGFAIAGGDGVFRAAEAAVQGRAVRVWHPDVARPVAVRYAWLDNPQQADLVNAAGLPASPFRTDRWPLTTADRPPAP